MAPINADRLIADLRELASIGKFGTGVDRVALSAADIEARRWLMGRMREAGLTAQMDCVGNVYGRYPNAGRAILVGSHTDTVPQGGWLDGALGVIYGLEIARASIEAGGAAEIGVDVVAFQDEEGWFLPCLGSRSFCENVTDAEIEAAKSKDGRPLADALAILRNEDPLIRCDPDRVLCYLEAHIEQGPRLESAGAAHRCCHRAGRNSPLSASAARDRPITPAPRRWPCARTPAWRCSGWGRGLRTNSRASAARIRSGTSATSHCGPAPPMSCPARAK